MKSPVLRNTFSVVISSSLSMELFPLYRGPIQIQYNVPVASVSLMSFEKCTPPYNQLPQTVCATTLTYTLYAWLLSFSRKFKRFIHIVKCISSHSFLLLSSSSLYECITIYLNCDALYESIHSTVDGSLSFFSLEPL